MAKISKWGTSLVMVEDDTEVALAIRDTWRGHKITDRDGAWVYVSDGVLVADDPLRVCGHCHLVSTPAGHDGCLGTLPDVKNACCGHGTPEDAYIQYQDGRRLAGAKALEQVKGVAG